MYTNVADVVMQKRGHDSCGNTTYKAGRESSSRFRTQDETGLGSACCRHLNILVTGNLKTGESYRFVHHFHKMLWALGYLYFCYDVICNYSIFSKDVAKLSVGHPDHEAFDQMSTEMTGFLSVFHGRTHVWDCQVIWLKRSISLHTFLTFQYHSIRLFIMEDGKMELLRH